jgi:site-specific DNA-methyltransferase (adenine-specific)
MAVLWSSKSDEWETPQDLYEALDREFNFTLDAAATAENAKCPDYLGPDHPAEALRDALRVSWGVFCDEAVWCNPPYSKVRAFVEKAVRTSLAGTTVVMLLPARTDTRWFHDLIWDRHHHRPLYEVEVRFLKGRLKFGGSKDSAPFPSMVVVFRGL